MKMMKSDLETLIDKFDLTIDLIKIEEVYRLPMEIMSKQINSLLREKEYIEDSLSRLYMKFGELLVEYKYEKSK